MKKLLSATLALTIGATCAIGVMAGCNNNEDNSKAVNEAIQYIRLLYEGDPVNTTNSFTLSGVAPGDGKTCEISWSVSMPDGYNVDAYFTFSPLDEDDMITVYISRDEADVEYTLTATAKYGKSKASFDFNRNLVGLGKIYTTAEIAALDQNKSVSIQSGSYTNKYYSEDNETAAVVAVRGYIVDEGSWSDTYNNFTNVYIADTYSAEMNKNSTGALQVYRLKTDEVYILGENDVERGTRVTLQGCIQFYNGSPELTYQGSTDVTCIGMNKIIKTESQRVSEALEKVSSTMEISVAGATNLPTPSVKQVSFSWALKSGTAAAVSGSQLIVSSLPSADATVVITVTATCGSATEKKDITVTIKAPLAVGTSVKFDFASVAKGDELNATTALALFQAANSTTTLTAVEVTKVYAGNGTGGGSYQNAGGLLKMGTSSLTGQIKLTFSEAVAKVEIKAIGWPAGNQTDTLSVNGSAAQSLSKTDETVYTFNLSSASQVVTIDSNLRALVFEIVVYFAA